MAFPKVFLVTPQSHHVTQCPGAREPLVPLSHQVAPQSPHVTQCPGVPQDYTFMYTCIRKRASLYMSALIYDGRGGGGQEAKMAPNSKHNLQDAFPLQSHTENLRFTPSDTFVIQLTRNK